MSSFFALFSHLCGYKERSLPMETSPLESPKRKKEQTIDDLQNKKTADDNSDANPELPLPPARKAALRQTYSCNDMVLQKSGSRRKKLGASLSIKMRSTTSIAQKRDGEEDKSVREEEKSVRKKRHIKAENSILVRPIILGEKCKVLDEEEGDEDYSQRMPKHRIYHPRSFSSISFSRTNSRVDLNVIPVEDASEDSMTNEGK